MCELEFVAFCAAVKLTTHFVCFFIKKELYASRQNQTLSSERNGQILK